MISPTKKNAMPWLAAIITGLLLTTPVRADEKIFPKIFGSADSNAAIASLPEKSEKPFVDRQLIDNGDLGMRVFRVYNPVPRHQHKFSDTYLYIVSGEAEILINGKDKMHGKPGDVLFWQAGVDHEVPRIIKHPLVVLAIDNPFRREGDVHMYEANK